MGISILQFMPHNRLTPPFCARPRLRTSLPFPCGTTFYFNSIWRIFRINSMENCSIYYLLLGAQHRRTISIERPFTPLHKVDTPLLSLSLSLPLLSPVCVCASTMKDLGQFFVVFIVHFEAQKVNNSASFLCLCVGHTQGTLTRTHTHAHTKELDKVLSHSHKQFAVQDTKSCRVRT